MTEGISEETFKRFIEEETVAGTSKRITEVFIKKLSNEFIRIIEGIHKRFFKFILQIISQGIIKRFSKKIADIIPNDTNVQFPNGVRKYAQNITEKIPKDLPKKFPKKFFENIHRIADLVT